MTNRLKHPKPCIGRRTTGCPHSALIYTRTASRCLSCANWLKTHDRDNSEQLEAARLRSPTYRKHLARRKEIA